MINSDKIILHLCATEGSDSKPYRDAGYDVRIIGEDIGVENYNPPTNIYGIIANPPCTQFSIARTTSKTPRDLREGMRLVKECLRIIWECQYNIIEGKRIKPLAFWMIENPGTALTKWFLGKPAFEYCQSEYGEPFTKKTALWGDFNLPKRPILSLQLPVSSSKAGHKWHKMHGSTKKEQMQKRSSCPIGFAEAFYEANP